MGYHMILTHYQYIYILQYTYSVLLIINRYFHRKNIFKK